MAEPISTPRLPPPQRIAHTSGPGSKDQLLSSSPAFGTPAYPIQPRQRPISRLPFAPQTHTTTTSNNNAPTVLPILLPPQTLRPVAFRTLTKKHNLTLTSSGLGVLSTFVGKHCGSAWREDGLAERVLDEIAKSWKRIGGGLIVEDGPDKKLSNLLKTFEPCMSGGRLDTGKLSRQNSSVGSLSRSSSFNLRPEISRDDSQTSLGISGLTVQEPGEIDDHSDPTTLDPRSYLKVVSAFDQPRLTYSTSKKTVERVSGPPTLLSATQNKTAMFRNRYHLIHQRLMRNESFQAPAFSSSKRKPALIHSGSSAASLQQAYKITPISNLLGRSGSFHLLLGMLVHSAAGDLALTDLSGSVVLDMSTTRPIPEDGAWYCPGMIVLVEGRYLEDGSNNSNLGTAAGIGGQIKGSFVAETMAGPPAERRSLTLGLSAQADKENLAASVGAGFGWVDFLGVGSEKALGAQMRRIQRRILKSTPQTMPPAIEHDQDQDHHEEEIQVQLPRTKIAIVAECTLDNPRTLEGIRAILSSYANASTDEIDYPLSIILMGNFISAASMAGSTKGGGSVEYKEYFDGLASVMSEFPNLLATSTFVFVPGDNDPWASSFSAGGATVLPRQGVPEIFTSRIRRAFAAANTELGRKERNKDLGEAVWATNPARLTMFGPVEELVLFRDDITGRFRRNAVSFAKLDEDDEDEEGETGHQNGSHSQSQAEVTDTFVEDMALDADDGVTTTGLDAMVHEATSHVPTTSTTTTTSNSSTNSARKLIKTVLDQSHLAPFSHSIRPIFWDHAASLSLYPLPTALVLADADTPSFAISYEGCHVMNPGRVVDEDGVGSRRGLARWVEYDAVARRGELREVRF
ncbi:hypothetical protein PV10_06387 [Exophiala mesophila]|uniref:DNA polymerase epsilon subunit B n=1 Tax=Exophiala mesophila TaxID=212818 RepID=A0A0D1ZB35_EXOME|nr:uncharacterized protein PV10_06387 [Exophiala mesophila]KIV91897.1 hypothetical protein PV10_06387 [Exophiala mesophila]